MDFSQVFPINLNGFVFDWSFSHLPRFNWCCWTIPKCSYFTQMFLILPKTLFKFFRWLKFDEGCWNYHMIPVHWREIFILPSGIKKNGKIVSGYFAVLLSFCHWFGCHFASLWKIDTTSHVNVAVYSAQILKIFTRIMASFSVGMRPHPLHHHAVRLCLPLLILWKVLIRERMEWSVTLVLCLFSTCVTYRIMQTFLPKATIGVCLLKTTRGRLEIFMKKYTDLAKHPKCVECQSDEQTTLKLVRPTVHAMVQKNQE